MRVKALVGFLAGAVLTAAPAQAGQSGFSQLVPVRAIAASPESAPLARKGDRRPIAARACETAEPAGACGSAPAARWTTVEERIGEGVSVLVRLPDLTRGGRAGEPGAGQM